MDIALSTWYSRAGWRIRGAASSAARSLRSTWSRAVSALPSLRGSSGTPSKPGVSGGRVASSPTAELDLRALASSPTVFAAVTRLALGLTVYPIRCYSGYTIGGDQLAALDPEIPWVSAFLRLLHTPDPADTLELCPEPGEAMLAQIIADLRLTGDAFVVPTIGAAGSVIGLTRLHPQLVSLLRQADGDWWVYRPGNGPMEYYRRRSVFHIHLLSWEKSGQGELGTGAGASLRPLVDAEELALQQTASMVRQGGADVIVTSKTAAGANFLTVKENRDKVVENMTEAIKGAGGRRIFVVPGDLEIKDSGLKPADLRSPELLKEARMAELVAVGVVPVAVGADSGTYATAVQQYRVQAEQDQIIVAVLEAHFLRPLARHFCRQAQGRWAQKWDQVTARIDIATHPGYAYVRTDALTRMQMLVAMGWSPMQAAHAENLDLPEPMGTPGPAPARPPGPVPGEIKDPRKPVGAGDAPDGQPPEPARGAVGDLFN